MEKILIVDDDKGIQKQLKWSLSDYDAALADDRECIIVRAAFGRYTGSFLFLQEVVV